jgi:hypothetical protein
MNKLDQYLPFGLTADSLLVILVASLAFITVVAVWYGLLERHPMERRAKMLAERRDQLRGQMLKDKPRKRRSESLGAMRQVVDLFKLMQSQSGDPRRCWPERRQPWHTHAIAYAYVFLQMHDYACANALARLTKLGPVSG